MSERPHSMSCEYPEGCSCGASSWNEREAEIVRLKAELKDAQTAVIISRIQCVYCGTCMDVNSTDTLEHQFENHARSCPEHPMRVVEQERDALKAEKIDMLVWLKDAKAEVRRLNELLHKQQGMANEVNLLVKENKSLAASLTQAREALRSMVCQFAPWSERHGGYCTGGMGAIEEAFEVLDCLDVMPAPEDACQVDGCKKQATCGTNTPTGYVRCCTDHMNEIETKALGGGG